MPSSVPSLMQPPQNTSPWTVVGGFHTALNQYGADPCGLLFEGHNNANAKYMSQPTPSPGQNPNISTSWDLWFKFNNAISDYMNFVIANQQLIQISSASIRGYAVRIATPSGVAPDAIIGLLALNGGGTYTVVSSIPWAGDTNFHHLRLSREVSGANRFWRIYFDDMTTPILEPTNNTTYTNFQWWGWDCFTRPRIVVGGESCQS